MIERCESLTLWKTYFHIDFRWNLVTLDTTSSNWVENWRLLNMLMIVDPAKIPNGLTTISFDLFLLRNILRTMKIDRLPSIIINFRPNSTIVVFQVTQFQAKTYLKIYFSQSMEIHNFLTNYTTYGFSRISRRKQ